MNKNLQDLAWSCLPKEFKKEVKRLYAYLRTNEFEKGCGYAFKTLFGYHNLTSDAEGEEELLTVSRKEVQNIYAQCEKIEMDDSPDLSADIVGAAGAKMGLLEHLFGSKCLPDEEPKPTEDDDIKVPEPKCKHYKDGKCAHPAVSHLENGKLVKGAECDVSSCEDVEYEPKPAEPKEPTCTDNCSSQCPRSDHIPDPTKMIDDIIKGGFREHNRLQIAAMAMQGILSNSYRMKQYGEIAMRESENLTQLVARNALRYADAIIAECDKK